VAVVSDVKPFKTIPYSRWRHVNRRYDLFFQRQKFFVAFHEIIENCCNLCPELVPFRNFSRLQEHVNKVHQLHYCDICVKNLKLFPWEFKMYTRQKLTAHRRSGDAEDSSYKGHPYCQFCNERYLDNDALHIHLRRQHFWCHFCEADGKQDFFSNIHSLRSHFKKDHYLCEEGDCYHEVLSAAFRNEIDLKAHVTSTHSKGLSKAEVKKMRHLPVEFYVNSVSVTEDDFPANRRRAVPISRGSARGGSGSAGTSSHQRDAVRSAHVR
jgi:quinol monooxygenase YgiN